MENLITIYKADYYISQNITKQRITNRRTVSHYEIELYATDGSTSVINDVKHPQKRGNILIAKPGDTRYSIDPFECYCVHFSALSHTVTDAISHLPAVFCLRSENSCQLFSLRATSSAPSKSTLDFSGVLLYCIGDWI